MRNNDENIPLPASILGDPESPILMKIHDNDLADAGIMNGDWVVVNEQKTAADGDLVAIWVDGDGAVRRFGEIDGDDWTLIGKVVAIMRQP